MNFEDFKKELEEDPEYRKELKRFDIKWKIENIIYKIRIFLANLLK